MKKKLIIAVFAAAFAFLAFSGAAMAKQDIPQVNGIYDVPGHPDLKVRVFVHEAKPHFGKESNALPSCTDPGSNAIVKSAGWHLPDRTWNYNLNVDSAPTTIGENNFVHFTGLAFSEWRDKTDLAGTNVVFNYAGDTTTDKEAYDGKNIITWGSASNNALAVNYTWYDKKIKIAIESDIIMNKGFSWSWMNFSSGACGIPGTYDAQNILTHEIGHSVGLNDHYTKAYGNNTMYGYGAKEEIKKDTLTAGDIAGVAKIY